MMLVTAYANGTTAGSPPPKRDRYGGERGEVKGWSKHAVRRHTKWLYSVDERELTGLGFAVTLTVRDCPPSETDWKRVREAFLARMRRAGVVRVHWVTEWQRRRVPHLHLALYVDGADTMDARHRFTAQVFMAWLEVAAEFRPSWRSQTVAVIDEAGGWLKYLSKHAARGVDHYQRQGSPDGWTKTGRLWGHGGEWPVLEPMKFDMPTAAYHRYRRMIRAWRISNARAELAQRIARPVADPREQEKRLRIARRRITSARRMLASSDRSLSAVRGVSEWAGESHTLALVALLADEFPVIQRTE